MVQDDAATVEKLNEMAEVVAAARTTKPPTESPHDASHSEETVKEEENITARIDNVDPAARIAQLDKLKADMERNFMTMKRVYGGGGAKKAAPVAEVVQDEE